MFRRRGGRGHGGSCAQTASSLEVGFQLALGTLAVACAAATSVPGAYLALLTSLGATPSRDDRSRRLATSNEARRFAFLVPAHNEERGIAAAIASLRSQRYSADLFEIHVVADNCTDRTADVAASAGATVHERSASHDPGKGPALNWLTERVVNGDGDVCRSVDVIVIVDADTIVDPEFLHAMNEAFARGSIACQGYYAVSEPEAAPSIALRYAALASRHYLRPLGRRRLGGSVGLFGNGMAFSTDLIARTGLVGPPHRRRRVPDGTPDGRRHRRLCARCPGER